MMAPRKNTQSAEDSLKGAQPEQAEAEQQAVAPETGQQQTGGSDEGDTGVAAGPASEQAPDQTDAERQESAPETGQEQTGGSDKGDTGAAAGQEYDAARAVLMRAISSITAEQAQVLPSTVEIRIPRRIATAATIIQHDLMLYASGEPIPVNQTDFTALSKAGAVIEDDWDDLAPEED